MEIRNMAIADYEDVHMLWMSCAGMGLNNLDDSREDLVYRNRAITEMIRIDT